MPLVSPTLKKLFSAKQEFYLGIILGITTLASSVTIRLIRYVNSNFSFRSGYRVIGILGLIFSLVGSYLIKGSRWESVSSLSFFQTIAFIFKKKGTRLISLSLFLGNLINLALFNNLIPYLKDMGISDVKGSALSSTAVFMMLFARPLWGAVFMKMKTKKAFMLLSLSPFITSAFYILAFKNIGFIYPSLIFLSFCSCFNTIPASSFAKIYKEKGSDAFTSFMMSGFLGSAVGSTLAALSFDFSMSYFPAWIAFLCISPVITAMTFFFKEEDVL